MTTNDYNFEKNPESYWIASTEKTNYPKLEGDINVDVAVIGGGITGLTSAYLLKQEGLSVAVLESSHIAEGTTGHTTAKVTSQHNIIYEKIKRQFGEERAKQYADANESAIKMIAQLVDFKKIDCDFIRKSAYVYTQEDRYIEKISEEVKTAVSLGLKATYLDELSLPFKVKAAYRFDNQAQFHPRKYLLALAPYINCDNSHIFENTKITDIKEGDKCTLIAENGSKVVANNVIIASHFPFYDGLGLYFARIYPEREYVLGMQIKEKLPDGMYVSAEETGYSLRTQPYNSDELVLLTGQEHKTGQRDATSRYSKLKTFADSIFNVRDVPFRWSTQDYTTMDGVPYIGHLTAKHKNIFVATGFGKWGMTNGTVAGMLLRDLITKGESPFQDVYSPSRNASATSVKKLVQENINVAGNLIGGKLLQVPDDVQVENGEARVIEKDGNKIGVYRDENGVLYSMDTTCTHMGCELQWNTDDKSWDCPCHGSRFSYTGKVLEGPAIREHKCLKK